MNLENLLKYQEADIQLRRIYDAIEKSEDGKKIEQAKSDFAAAKKTVESCEINAEKVLSDLDEAKKFYNDAQKELEELELVIENGTEDAEEILARASKLREKAALLDKKVSEDLQRGERLRKEYLDANERGKKSKEVHAEAKEKQNKLLKTHEKEVVALKAELEKLEPTIDADLMKKYKALTAERKYPAFVESYTDGANYSCRGCGMTLSSKNKAVLDENSFAVCETCRRIIYKKK